MCEFRIYTVLVVFKCTTKPYMVMATKKNVLTEGIVISGFFLRNSTQTFTSAVFVDFFKGKFTCLSCGDLPLHCPGLSF